MTLLRKEDGQSLQKMLTTNLQEEKKRPFLQLPSEIILFPLKADNNVHFTQQLRVEKKKEKT